MTAPFPDVPLHDPSAGGSEWPGPNDDLEIAVILQLYCAVEAVLQEQFVRFDAAGSLSFSILNGLINTESNKGPLWWLKDSAHNVLCNPAAPASARLLDWGIGYIFHEVLKLAEAVQQHRSYLPEMQTLARSLSPSAQADIAGFHLMIGRELSEDLARGVRRIRNLLGAARRVLILAYAGLGSNCLLGRGIYIERAVIQSVFRDEEYDELITSIFGPEPETLFLVAGRSFFEGGYFEKAREAAAEALKIAPENKTAQELLHNANTPPQRAPFPGDTP